MKKAVVLSMLFMVALKIDGNNLFNHLKINKEVQKVQTEDITNPSKNSLLKNVKIGR